MTLAAQECTAELELAPPPQCLHCGEQFTPRAHTGGKPQRFCSPACRTEFHSQRSQRNGSHVGEEKPVPQGTPADNSGAPTASQIRTMLINGGRDYAKHFPEETKDETPEECVDRMMLTGMLKPEPQPSSDAPEFDWNAVEDDDIALPEQAAVAVYFNTKGDLVIRQQVWNGLEDDHLVIINRVNIGAFLDKLTDACGIPSAGN